YTADLANDFGNLVNRSLSMIGRYRQGTVPKAGDFDALDGDLRATAEKAAASYQQRMNELDTGAALTELWQLVTRANRYVEESAPWKLAKDPAQASRLDSVLYNLAESVRLISVLATPFLPTTARQMREQLGVADKLDRLAEEIGWGRLAAGATIGQVAPLFPKRT
ncbi:MAG: methionine--tRNA ligase, partial [Verrucomicrobiia bacterium]